MKFNSLRFGALVFIISSLVLVNLHAVNADRQGNYDVILYTPETVSSNAQNTPTTHIVSYGGETTFNILVKNVGTTYARFNVRISSPPKAPWSANLEDNTGYLGTVSFQLSPNEVRSVTLHVRAPSSSSNCDPYALTTVESMPEDTCGCEDAGDVQVNVEGRQWVDCSNKITVLTIICNHKTPPMVHIVAPGASTIYNMDVINNGDVQDTYSILNSVPDPLWSAQKSTNSVFLLAGDSEPIQLTVTAPMGQDGDFTIVNVTARSQGQPTVQDTVVTITIISRIYGVDVDFNPITCPEHVQYVLPGKTATFNLTLTNKGTTIDSFTLETLDVPAGWSASLSVTKINNLNAGATAYFMLNVTSPQSAGLSERADIRVRGTSLGDPSKRDEVIPAVITNTPYFVLLEGLELVKYVYPCETAIFNITATNFGTVSDTFKFTVTTDGELSAGWTFSLSTYQLTISPKSSATLVLSVTASCDALFNDKEQIIIRADSSAPPGSIGKLTDRITTTTIVKQVHKIEADGYPAYQSVDPCSNAYFTINVANKGNWLETVRPEVVDGPTGWSYTFYNWGKVVDSMDLAIRANGTFSMEASIPCGTPPGNYSIRVVISDSVNDRVPVNFTVHVNPFYMIKLNCSDPIHYVDQGDTTTFIVTVRNIGNLNDTALINFSKISGRTDWVSQISIRSVYLLVGQATEFTYTVAVPYDAMALEQLVSEINAQSAGDFTKTDRLNLTAIANQVHKINATISPPVISVYPGEYANYTINITNKGNGIERITLAMLALPHAWNYEFTQEGVKITELTLNALSNTTITLRIKTPVWVPFSTTNPTAGLAGNYTFNISVGAEGGFIPLSAMTIIKQIYNFTIEPPKQIKDAKRNDVKTFLLSIKNFGNGPDLITIALEDATGWGIINLKPIPINASETKGNVLELTVTIPNNARNGRYNFIIKGTSSGPIEFPVTSNATCTIVISEKPTNSTGGGCLDIALLLAVILCGVMLSFYLYRKYRKSSSIDKLTDSEDAIEEFEEFVEEPKIRNDTNNATNAQKDTNDTSGITTNSSDANKGNKV